MFTRRNTTYFASYVRQDLVDASISLKQVAALFGHKSLDPVMIYIKLSQGDLERG
jgi:hypothetical protein